MQIAEISFADKIAYNIKADDTKKYILDNLEKKYGLKIITRHFESFTQQLMPTINSNPYMISARSNGNPYFLHLLRYNFNNYCIFIDKKIQQGYYYPRMIICNFQFDDVLFDDTVFEGELIKTSSNNWVFIINDLLVVKGTYLNDQNLIKRINLLYSTLNDHYIEDDMDICKLKVKKYFTTNNINELLNTHIPKLPYSCRGIYFKPLFLRFRDILVNFDDSVVKKVERKKYKNTGNFLLQLPKEESPVITPEIIKQEKQESMRQFFARKTSNPDTYELFDASNAMQGFACVPTMKISKVMRKMFESKNMVDKIEITCEFSDKFKKWIPVV